MDGQFLPVGTDQTSGWLKKQIQVYDNMCALNPMYFQLKRFAIFITDKIRYFRDHCRVMILSTYSLSLLTCMFL